MPSPEHQALTRDELVTELRKFLTAHQGGSAVPYKHAECDYCDHRIAQVMALVDAYAATLTNADAPQTELWTVEQVAEYAGYEGNNAEAQARATVSKLGIKRAATQPHPGTGRLQALYPASQVRYAIPPKKERD